MFLVFSKSLGCGERYRKKKNRLMCFKKLLIKIAKSEKLSKRKCAI